MAAVRIRATAVRVLVQLRHDPRTVVLLLVVPCLLLALLRYAFDSTPTVFDRIGPALLVLFPFTTMFLVSSVAMLRERSSGTLERLLSTPVAKAEVLLGYALAFGTAAVVQATVASGVAVGWLGLTVAGGTATLVGVAVLVALLGMASGLALSALARTEFQAVQFLPAFVLPQLLLCGLFVTRDVMPVPLRVLSDVFPLSYAVDAVTAVATGGTGTTSFVRALVVLVACLPVALALGAATLRRRTA